MQKEQEKRRKVGPKPRANGIAPGPWSRLKLKVSEPSKPFFLLN